MNFLKYSIVIAALGVAMGAFGAHALKDFLIENGSLESWKTAVFYHLIHALALFALSLSRLPEEKGMAKMAAALWIVGIVLFSGSLYGLAALQWSFLGPITPIGGLALILGWLFLFGLDRR